MNEDRIFTKLCWVCLAEENDMNSLLDEDVIIEIDKNHAPISLCDILTYMVQSEIFFVGGPHLICNNCKLQAYAAYKFKKRCEVSLKTLEKCKLKVCKKEDYPIQTIDTQVENEDIETCNEEDHIDGANEEENDLLLEDCVKEETAKQKGENTVTKDERNDQIVSSSSSISNLPNPSTENTKLPKRSYKKLLCSICGLEISRTLKHHMRRHANIKKHTCPYCQKKFIDKGNLKVHIRIHTGVRPYICDICGKKFNDSASLKIHKLIHEGVKPHKCHICTFSTRTSSHLQLHIKRHAGVKDYHCEQCEYSACSKTELKYHLAKHSDDKCHICKLCGKGFTRYKGLKAHEKSHTGEKPHVCEFCNRGFTQAHSLRSHLRNIHKKAN